MANIQVKDEHRILWRPSRDQVTSTGMFRFSKLAAARSGRPIDNFSELHDWSIDCPEEFWGLLWDFLDLRYSESWRTAYEQATPMWQSRFFVGSKLNFAENLLRVGGRRGLLIFRDELGNRIEWSADELWNHVAGLADALRTAGVVAGDRVVALVPNHPLALASMLAATSIGAIWSSCSPDFGKSGILDRFGQIEPKLLIACGRYHYNGRTFDLLPRIAEVVEALPSLEKTLVFPYLDESLDLSAIRNGITLEEFRSPAKDIKFEQLPFDHPLFILFTSGTTGVPKCIVHRTGGALVQIAKEHRLHCDLGSNDRLFFFTTCGWMMWNWLVTGLASESTLVLYDGSPFYPGAASLWQLAQQEQVTVFGISAKYLSGLEKQGFVPANHFDLSKLRLLLSTGSVLPPESYDYVYEKVKADLLLASMTGGTDLLSCFALGSPTLPLYRGELQCPGLGMAVSVFNEAGESVVGESGELVCGQAFPTVPIGFWKDEGHRRFRAAYFERFAGVWHHGDLATVTEHGGLIMQGRSDAVLNPGGVRIGTAEIYRQVDKLDEVMESICVCQDWDKDVRVVLFVVLAEGVSLDEELIEGIRFMIRSNASPRHVPAKIIAVPDVPRTRTGKLAEIAVRETVHGRPVANTEALANSECLRYFADRPELRY